VSYNSNNNQCVSSFYTISSENKRNVLHRCFFDFEHEKYYDINEKELDNKDMNFNNFYSPTLMFSNYIFSNEDKNYFEIDEDEKPNNYKNFLAYTKYKKITIFDLNKNIIFQQLQSKHLCKNI
jgi:hypothetical protein